METLLNKTNAGKDVQTISNVLECVKLALYYCLIQ
jgi:hypothetical protein